MKRNVISLLLVLLILVGLSLNVSAVSDLALVVDNAGLLSTQEQAALEDKARSLGTEYGMDIVILTVDRLDGKRPQNYADDYYDYHGYGDNGILFLLAMEERDWYISTCGDAIYALTDYGIQKLGDTVIPYLSDGDYYNGFDAYLNALPYYLESFQSGAPVDGYADYSGDYYHGDQETIVYSQQKRSPNILLSLVIGMVVAAAAVLIMRASMNTKRMQYSASDYMNPGSFHLRTQQDIFLYSNVTKVRRQENNNSSGGGGGGSSVHTSSSGRSHGGGGGKF